MKNRISGTAAMVSRRSFVVGSAAAGGGLALGFNLPDIGTALAQAAGSEGTEVNAWVLIKPDDTCVIRIARSEMGQGTLTGLAQLVAEELECDWTKVTTESITAGQNLARKRIWGEMGTGGSRGIRTSPLICTEQAPHCATPHPYFVPVRPTCSRMTHRSGVSDSACTSRTLPLILSFAMSVPLASCLTGKSWPRCLIGGGRARTTEIAHPAEDKHSVLPHDCLRQF